MPDLLKNRYIVFGAFLLAVAGLAGCVAKEVTNPTDRFEELNNLNINELKAGGSINSSNFKDIYSEFDQIYNHTYTHTSGNYTYDSDFDYIIHKSFEEDINPDFLDKLIDLTINEYVVNVNDAYTQDLKQEFNIYSLTGQGENFPSFNLYVAENLSIFDTRATTLIDDNKSFITHLPFDNHSSKLDFHEKLATEIAQPIFIEYFGNSEQVYNYTYYHEQDANSLGFSVFTLLEDPSLSYEEYTNIIINEPAYSSPEQQILDENGQLKLIPATQYKLEPVDITTYTKIIELSKVPTFIENQ